MAHNGEKDHLHNQLIAAIYGNVTREMPDQGLASWVSTNDKPAASASKPVSGDAAERRLKGDVMQLPARDRRRIKDLVQNDVCESQQPCVNRKTNLRCSLTPLRAYRTSSPKRDDEGRLRMRPPAPLVELII